MNTLVIPVIWADQTNMANDETLALLRDRIGRIVDKNGNVVDYSNLSDEAFSLSEYYDIASYGKLKITSFMTDWYYSTKKFADVCNSNPNVEYANEILAWVKATYPSLDWSKYDKDKNGYVDSLVILNLGVNDSDWIPTISYSGAINYRHTYFGDYAGTPTSPLANVFTTVGYHYFKDNASTLIHEFAHGFGIIDYYDVSYSGIDAVGKFDMQSANAGDWNAYSKTAVGWTDPTVVSGLDGGKSVEIKIGSSALTDDVIIIPAKGKT